MKRKDNLVKGSKYYYKTEGIVVTYITDDCGGVYAGCATEDGYTFTVFKSSLLSIEQAQRNLVEEIFDFLTEFDTYNFMDEVCDRKTIDGQKQETFEEIRKGNTDYLVFYLDTFNLDKEDELWIEDIKNKLQKLGGKQ